MYSVEYSLKKDCVRFLFTFHTHPNLTEIGLVDICTDRTNQPHPTNKSGFFWIRLQMFAL